MEKDLSLDFVHKAFVDGFDNDSLKRLLRLKLGRDIETISRGGTLEETVFDIIHAAKKEGWLDELITHAKEANPGNYFVSMLGGEDSMQQYDRQDDISEIRIVLFGSMRGATPGFIELTNDKLNDIDDRVRRIEIVFNERSTVGTAFFESWAFKVIALVLGLSAIGSLALGVIQVYW